MEEMVSQLSVMVEDLKVERRYALSTLTSRRIREAQHAVEHASALVTAAMWAGEADARRRMDDSLLSVAALRAEAVAATVTAEDAIDIEYTDSIDLDRAMDMRAEDAVGVDYTVDYD